MNPIYGVPEGKEGWTVEVITEDEIDMRKQIWALFKTVKENVPGSENSYREDPGYDTRGKPLPFFFA